MKKNSFITTVVLVLLAVLITFQITYLSMGSKYEKKLAEFEGGEFAKLLEIKNLVDANYVREYDEEELADALASAYSEGIGDKYGAYFSADEIALVNERYHGEVVGIGISVIYNEEIPAMEVCSVNADSPAEAAGIKAGDYIIAVGGESVGTIGYNAAIDAVRGEEGTEVTVTILRDDSFDLTIKRAKVNEVSVFSKVLYDGITGFVRITSFNSTTAADFKAAMKELQANENIVRYIFDVRNNSGGELNAIISVLDFLLPAGPIVRMVDKNGAEEVKSSDAACVDAPMAVLTNGYTASAAELFTIGLRDYKKAVIVGEKTYGKGTVQTLYTLSDGSVLSLSNKMYCGPYSDNYESIGIEPDVKAELSETAKAFNFFKLPEIEDDQLKAALGVFDNYASYFENKNK